MTPEHGHQEATAGVGDAEPALARRTATGAAWGASSAVLYQAVALVVQVTLTYLLTKEEYGLYGVAVAIVNFGTLFQQVGFFEVLQHRRASLHLWMNPAGWLAASLGLLGSLMIAAAAWPVGVMYDNSTLTRLVLLLAPIPLIRGMTILPTTLLMDQMRFRTLYSLMGGAGIANLLLVLAFASAGMGPFSFALAPLVVDPLHVILLWLATRPRVRRRPQVGRWRYLVGDLGMVFGSNLARWVRSSADALILALAASKAEVGVYYFGLSFPVQIVRVVTLNLATALLPSLNRMQGDTMRQVRGFLRAARVLMLIGAPMCVGLAAISSIFTRVFLDAAKWHDLPPILSVLSLGVAFRLIDEPAQALLAAQGRFRTGLKLGLIMACVFVVMAAVGAAVGRALGTAVSVAAYYSMAGPLLLYVAVRPGGVPVVQVLRVFWEPLLLSIAAIAPWMVLERMIPGSGRARDAAALAGIIGLSSASYVCLAAALRLESWHDLIERVEHMAPRPVRGPLLWLRNRA